MDKNIGEQLNKAYEAFRQACMDRDYAVKEMQQKTESYVQQIREQQEQIELQKGIIGKLKSQLATNRGNAHGYVLPEDPETKRNDISLNLTFDQLYEKLNLAMQREKFLKEQLENESIRMKQIEEESNQKEKKLVSIIAVKEEKIRILNNRLIELNKVQNCMQMPIYKMEVKGKKDASDRPELSPGIPGISAVPEREALETIFQEVKEECHRICTLARKQTDQLSKFNMKKELVTDIQFSLPIQCTDRNDQQAEELFKPWVEKDINRGASCITSITPRGVGQDEEDNSVESLSIFNVKFPPTDNDSAFLQSTQDKLTMPCTVIPENVLQDCHFNMEHRDHAMNSSKLNSNSSEAHGFDPITSALQNLTTTEKNSSPNPTNMLIENSQDKTLCLTTGDIDSKFVHEHTNQDVREVKFPSSEATGTTVRGPHQPIWKPQDNDLLMQAYTESELNQSGICAFCQEVFPPSLTSKGDFLRHLNSHFNAQS
ncbi:PREDICTED: TRAF family member-associated NF-kappa-B activator isoform X1 [Crocodylus porosus]|uniref:TRAF family member associated NFKB activator n=1 Tax=Crocodylus porosus TaxID=8502 RepID=A0A7M4FRC3_CROPO|nr:PREDICTED: TRAF family member-associated NF-kappa-B activator isoform X1 [Crocodylus porosus]XP_019409868.1 PREDICTED: TRAF family member-associated NF-kappa-B activator isoform X1 [Crocodylus porosus]XP_019409869.1 PREDICTED: TRAF family member-associated NF-kappa-B activator isoform X1 [Crocodylus porosus]